MPTQVVEGEDLITVINDQIDLFAQQIGGDVNDLRLSLGKLENLDTVAKSNVIVAINEALAKGVSIESLLSTDYSTTVETNTTIDSKVATAISTIVNGAGEQLDTLKEISDAFATADSDLLAMINNVVAQGTVRFDEAQVLSEVEKTTARSNIGALSQDEIDARSDFVSNREIDTRVGTGTIKDFKAIYSATVTAPSPTHITV